MRVRTAAKLARPFGVVYLPCLSDGIVLQIRNVFPGKLDLPRTPTHGQGGSPVSKMATQNRTG